MVLLDRGASCMSREGYNYLIEKSPKNYIYISFQKLKILGQSFPPPPILFQNICKISRLSLKGESLYIKLLLKEDYKNLRPFLGNS